MAEEVGFEPTEELASLNGFQDRLLKPLGHSSVVKEQKRSYIGEMSPIVNLFLLSFPCLLPFL